MRSRINPRAVLFDANLDLLSFDHLRRWQRDGMLFTVIDAETDHDITSWLTSEDSNFDIATSKRAFEMSKEFPPILVRKSTWRLLQLAVAG
jgi:hypothetical protein